MHVSQKVFRRIPKKLKVEFTPTTVRSNSLFYFYNQNKKFDLWAEIKNKLIEQEGNFCWICTKESSQLHLHEFWHFDDETKTMVLKEIHHVCQFCDKIMHADLWFLSDYGRKQLQELNLFPEDLIKHYCKVNDCSLKDFGKNWREAFTTWKKRSEINWFKDFGIFQPE
ncbi:MAG: hypothetical protein FK731_11500 [Asgard group archaeon]|nr:hypothetical protein [Asgard group archaeon]